VRLGHSVVVLCSTARPGIVPEKEMIGGVKVLCMPEFVGRRARNGGLGPVDTLMRCAYLLGERFDVVENFDHRPAVLYPALVAKYLRRMPLVSEWTDLHGAGGSLSHRPRLTRGIIGPYENFTERRSKKLPLKLIVISNGLRQRAVALGVPEAKIVLIPGGADVDNILPRQREEARKEFGLPLDRKIIAYSAGTLYDADLFLQTVSKIQKARADVLLITTGSRLSAEQKRQLEDPARIVEFGFLPYSNYAALLPAADLFIFPFSNRPLNVGRWPNKIGDYMAAGRPTVSNRTGDLVELFHTHRIGLLADDNPQDFARKALQMLSDDDLCAELGINARKTAEGHYDWSILTKRLENCLVEAIAESNVSRDRTV